VIGLRSASVRYPGATRPSLTDVDLEVSDGIVTGLAGASESGKTTLCLALSGLLPRVVRASFTGSLWLDGEDVGSHPMSVICERVSVLTGAPDATLSLVADTVYEEVAFGPANLGLSRDEVLRRVGSSLTQAGITDLAERDPRRLSTGQKQRLGVAAMLAMGARNLVLDEPSAHLDPEATGRLIAVVRRLADSGFAVVIASADTRLLSSACDRLAVLQQGRLGRVGPVAAVLSDPAIAAAGLEPVDKPDPARVLGTAR
jgi:energy-coupling factor transport system ATP-binding protein